MIIGLTGSLASGKGIIAEFLKEKGFTYLSLSNELREIAKERGIEITRKNLQDLGNYLRQEGGAEVLAKMTLDRIIKQGYNRAVVDSIRNPAEVNKLREMNNFFLIAVDAPQEIRYQRMFQRNRENDPRTFERFLEVDARDFGEENEIGQQVGKCIKLADFTIINDKGLKEARMRTEEVYNQILLRRTY